SGRRSPARGESRVAPTQSEASLAPTMLGPDMTVALPNLVAVPVWLVVGAAVGVAVRWLSVRLARWEHLEPGARAWQVYGPVLATAALFAVFAWRYGATPVLLIRSLWVAVLVQIIFFDFEHRLILDRVLVPSAAAALALSFVTPRLSWQEALITGVCVGL